MFFTGDIRNKKILLHACCGPCSLGALPPLLDDGGVVTLFFYNPCIVDLDYFKRLEAIKTVAEHYGVELIVPPHDYSTFTAYAAAHSADREGGARCELCMGDRIRVAAEYAATHGFDAYSTTLSVSPHKSSKLIFSIAERLSEASIGALFLARDFKKRDGFLRSTRLSRELGIYRQNFCGCEYSCVGRGEFSASAHFSVSGGDV